jgi:hypothetical protein
MDLANSREAERIAGNDSCLVALKADPSLAVVEGESILDDPLQGDVLLAPKGSGEQIVPLGGESVERTHLRREKEPFVFLRRGCVSLFLTEFAEGLGRTTGWRRRGQAARLTLSVRTQSGVLMEFGSAQEIQPQASAQLAGVPKPIRVCRPGPNLGG